MNKCSFCGGRGAVATPSNSEFQRCPLCDGTGQATDPGAYFSYSVDVIIGVNIGTVATASIQILDNPFKWMFAISNSTGNFTAQVSDGTSKRPFSNQQVQQANFWGTGQNPMPLLQPYVFGKRGQIFVALTNQIAGANTVELTFSGVELPA